MYDKAGEVVMDGPGFPMGLSFIGDLWSEEELIGMAYAYEQRSRVRGTLGRVVQPRTELGGVSACLGGPANSFFELEEDGLVDACYIFEAFR